LYPGPFLQKDSENGPGTTNLSSRKGWQALRSTTGSSEKARARFPSSSPWIPGTPRSAASPAACGGGRRVDLTAPRSSPSPGGARGQPSSTFHQDGGKLLGPRPRAHAADLDGPRPRRRSSRGCVEGHPAQPPGPASPTPLGGVIPEAGARESEADEPPGLLPAKGRWSRCSITITCGQRLRAVKRDGPPPAAAWTICYMSAATRWACAPRRARRQFSQRLFLRAARLTRPAPRLHPLTAGIARTAQRPAW